MHNQLEADGRDRYLWVVYDSREKNKTNKQKTGKKINNTKNKLKTRARQRESRGTGHQSDIH